MPSIACVVINCDSMYTDKVTRRHRFPKDPLRSPVNIWVQRSGNNKLLNKTVDAVYKSFVMCDKHFDSCYKSFGLQRLNSNAVPTLNLPSKEILFISFYMIPYYNTKMCLYYHKIIGILFVDNTIFSVKTSL